MAGNHYLDPGPCYADDTPQTLRAQARYEKAEADRAAFEALRKEFAERAIKLAADREIEPAPYWVKYAKEHRNLEFLAFVRNTLCCDYSEMFHLPDPQDEYDDEMGAE